MTEQTSGRAFPARNRSGTAEGLARPLSDEERALELPCWVRHENAGGQCPRAAAAMVYGLLFCEVHGAEATSGALSELYQDAGDTLERLDNPQAPLPNQEAVDALAAAWRMLDRRRDEHREAEEDALRRAYPYDPERVCAETVAFDYRMGPGNWYGPGDEPTSVYEDARRLLCKEMRLAYEEGADWLVEVLEYEREAASAQLAFALVDYERKVGTPEERAGSRANPAAPPDPATEALVRINAALTAASEVLETVPAEAFEGEEDYFRTMRAVAEAGGIVEWERSRRQRRREEDRPAE